MKKTLICALILASFGANASCYNTYQSSLREVNESIEKENPERIQMEGAAISGGLALTTTSTASGGSLAVSSLVGAKLMGALFVGSYWIDLRKAGTLEDLEKTKTSLEGAISILKEGRIGSGPFLQNAMPAVWKEVSSEVSLKEVADQVVELDEANAFCQGDQIASPAGILRKTIEGLK